MGTILVVLAIASVVLPVLLVLLFTVFSHGWTVTVIKPGSPGPATRKIPYWSRWYGCCEKCGGTLACRGKDVMATNTLTPFVRCPTRGCDKYVDVAPYARREND